MSERLACLRDYPQAHTLILGAIIGDIVGSPYEWPKEKRIHHSDFPLFNDESRFTDDTVLTMAVIKALIDAKKNNTYFKNIPFALYYRDFVTRYPKRGYSERFVEWISGDGADDSFGNGAAMRVSPIAYVYKDVVRASQITHLASVCTHNNPPALACAQLVTFAVGCILSESENQKTLFAQLSGFQKIEGFPAVLHSMKPKDYIGEYEGKSISSAVPSVPHAIACFLSTNSFEQAVRLAVAQGFDADTQASIAGALALPYYRAMPGHFIDDLPLLPEEFCNLLVEFSQLFNVPKVHLL